jgi:hypothetical protein
MVYKIALEPGFLRAELFERETAGEVKSFLRTVAGASVVHRRPCVLVWLHSSKPALQDEPFGLIGHFAELTLMPSCRIALLGDTADLQSSRQRIESIARKLGVNARVFQDEAAAIHWFRDLRQQRERRRFRERREPRQQRDQPALDVQQERRRERDRRLQLRRGVPQARRSAR